MKILLLMIVCLMLGAAISPVALMEIESTKNIMIGMVPDETILALADKINKESGKIDEQAQEIAFLKELRNKQIDEINALQGSNVMSACQKKKADCEKKIDTIDNGKLQIDRPGIWEGDRSVMIQKIQESIAGWKINKKEAADESHKADFQVSIDKAMADIKIIQDAVAKGDVEKKNLLTVECKDYTKTCE